MKYTTRLFDICNGFSDKTRYMEICSYLTLFIFPALLSRLCKVICMTGSQSDTLDYFPRFSDS